MSADSDSGRLVFEVPFHQIPDELVKDERTNVYHIAVFSVLAMHANKERSAWPSQNRLAQLCGASRNKIKQTAAELEEWGWIRTVKRWSPETRRYSSTIYYLSPSLQGWSPDDQGVGHDVTKGWSPDEQEPDLSNQSQLNHRKRSRANAKHEKLGVPINQARYDTLVTEYGKPAVDNAIQERLDWEATKGKPAAKDYAAAAANWLRMGNVPKLPAYVNDTKSKLPDHCSCGGEIREYSIGDAMCRDCGAEWQKSNGEWREVISGAVR